MRKFLHILLMLTGIYFLIGFFVFVWAIATSNGALGISASTFMTYWLGWPGALANQYSA